ncbi:MAG: AbrB/MazE/SpoVT family DNA-binding domain-containing protein [Caldilineales bacterium]|nr:AbrB/MazE/SpoVT family DNA-binding domain-containing protein [Caldilineales bacterium]MDW8319640.1 AbrB/MazE/SpoVT family DNA-binding domain-containing protein [Anaerolineae bacterium]
MNATVQIRQRGTLTLPAELREKYGLKEGDTLRIVDLDGVLVLTPMTPIVSELAREIERLRLAAGLSTEELLATLREQRARYHAEHYADADVPTA